MTVDLSSFTACQLRISLYGANRRTHSSSVRTRGGIWDRVRGDGGRTTRYCVAPCCESELDRGGRSEDAAVLVELGPAMGPAATGCGAAIGTVGEAFGASSLAVPRGGRVAGCDSLSPAPGTVGVTNSGCVAIRGPGVVDTGPLLLPALRRPSSLAPLDPDRSPLIRCWRDVSFGRRSGPAVRSSPPRGMKAHLECLSFHTSASPCLRHGLSETKDASSAGRDEPFLDASCAAVFNDCC